MKSTGSTYGAVSAGDVASLTSIVPPIVEQCGIVRFLDHADLRIRRYILAKQRLIAALEEQKQAIIHRAVTGRVDIRTSKPYPSYKDSGVDWLGRIPNHWSAVAAKRYFGEVDDRSETGTEELLSVSHVTGVTPRSEKNVTMFRAESYVGHKLCRPGDVVVNTMWAWMGALGMARQTGIVSPSYAVYRPRTASPLLGEYVELLLRTMPYRGEYRRRSTGIRPSRLRLYPDEFLRLPLLSPTPKEQSAIAEFAKEKTAVAAKHAQRADDEVNLMNEYRTRLIGDVVTGKLDVREAGAALPDTAPA